MDGAWRRSPGALPNEPVGRTASHRVARQMPQQALGEGARGSPRRIGGGPPPTRAHPAEKTRSALLSPGLSVFVMLHGATSGAAARVERGRARWDEARSWGRGGPRRSLSGGTRAAPRLADHGGMRKGAPDAPARLRCAALSRCGAPRDASEALRQRPRREAFSPSAGVEVAGQRAPEAEGRRLDDLGVDRHRQSPSAVERARRRGRGARPLAAGSSRGGGGACAWARPSAAERRGWLHSERSAPPAPRDRPAPRGPQTPLLNPGRQW